MSELKEMGVDHVEMDEHGYVIAKIPSNIPAHAQAAPEKVYSICFCAHVDTAPDCSGTDVRPILHFPFNGDATKLLPLQSSAV